MCSADNTEVSLRLATVEVLPDLLGLVREYHDFEGIDPPAGGLEAALTPLLEQRELGRVWLVRSGEQTAGYAVVCFGYSVEFGGRDAFLDELYLAEPFRGRGIGKQVLAQLMTEAAHLGIAALHLEVARANARAQRIYSAHGFAKRDGYLLMTARLHKRCDEVVPKSTTERS